ncbi:hypothetical protein A1O1_06953 [Capronia coronata CBS 617.96]|uniref:Major facilitator superfamily (MFS) profile domain-containing protein n=1 Tax=Capronia coronata CBS 617.96 TaxID=1182541 RepID=W9XS32_9EURO|nr:uncharacterized protein A1O1_06953 [Capronia coronata CBS 617.96]EXJ83332.1 hypothetical protein A1O1_06953 [Capronia coronata CBS 617.96]
MSETYKKAILRHRAKRLDSADVSDVSQMGISNYALVKAWVYITMFRPVIMLVSEPIVTLFSLYIALTFGILYNFFAALPFIFRTVYRFDQGDIGLAFVPICVGCCLAIVTTILIDRHWYHKQIEGQQECEDSVPPERRLYAAMFGSLGPPISLFWFAWTARANVHWMSPVIATMPFAWGNVCLVATTTVYLLDCYGPKLGASAMSAGAFTRYAFAAAFPLFTLQS